MAVIEHLSLLHGFVPIAIDLITVALAGVVVVALRRQWRRALIALAVALAAVATYSYLMNLPAQFHGRFPKSFFLWAAAPIAVVVAGVWCWRHISWWPRAAALLAVPLLVVCGLEQVNEFYGYVPTFGDLIGAPLPGQVTLKDVMHMVQPIRHGRFATVTVGVPAEGVLIGVTQPAPVSRFRHRATYVWLPPAWFENPRPKLPAMMLLEGSPGSPDNWLRVVRAMDVATAWARHHQGIAPIMVIPDSNGKFLGDSECVNGSAGPADTYLTTDVVNWATRNFDIGSWATVGLSEGGTCAIDLALLHPHLFHAFADFSGDLDPNLGTRTNTIKILYHGHAREWVAHDPMHLMATHRYPGLRGWFAAGRNDSKRVVARELAGAARRDGIAVELHITPGNHNFYFWKRAFAAAYPWLVQVLEPADVA